MENKVLKITKATIKKRMGKSIFDFEGYTDNEAEAIRRIITDCKENNINYDLSAYAKDILAAEKMDKLAQLFGATKGRRTSTNCSGKYTGTKDYYVTFDNGEKIYISNGLTRFDEILTEYVKLYSDFETYKPAIMENLRRMEAINNAENARQNLPTYTIIEVDYKRKGDSIGWFVVYIKINNKTYAYITSNIAYGIKNAVLSGNIEELQKEIKNNFWTSSGQKADIFINGHSPSEPYLHEL